MHKKIASTILAVIVALSLTGCGNAKDPIASMGKTDLVTKVKEQQKTLEDNDVKIQELQTLLKGIQQQDAPTAAISTINDGTGRLTFNSIKGKITFPTPFQYPKSSQAPNTSSINITGTLSAIPTDNWITQLHGTELELQHSPDGINGIIKAGTMTEVYDRDKMQSDVFSKFFANFPPEKIVYSKVFLNDQWWGLEAKTPTTVDQKPAYLRCGMVGVGSQCFTYMFVYAGNQDQAKDETIVALLKTMKLMGLQLRIE